MLSFSLSKSLYLASLTSSETLSFITRLAEKNNTYSGAVLLVLAAAAKSRFIVCGCLNPCMLMTRKFQEEQKQEQWYIY